MLILYKIEKENIFEKNKFGLYRDDGLALEYLDLECKSGPIIEHLSKRLRNQTSKPDMSTLNRTILGMSSDKYQNQSIKDCRLYQRMKILLTERKNITRRR